MSVFTSTRELGTQQQTRNFKVQTGWKKHAMALAGYKASGEKNWWGKWVGATPIAKNIAGKHLAEGSDAEEVIASQTGAELKHQFGTASFAASFLGGIGGGGGDAASTGTKGASSGGGMFAKAGQGTKGAGGGGTWVGGQINKFGGGGGAAQGVGNTSGVGSSMFKEGTKANDFMNSEAGKNLTDGMTAEGKKKIMDEINKNSDGTPNSGFGSSPTDNFGNNKDKSFGQAESTSNISGDPKTSSEAKGWKEASDYKGMGSHGLVGQFTNLYAEKMAIADAHKAKAQSMFNQKQTSAGSGYTS